MVLKNYLFIIFICFSFSVTAQNIDSLKNELNRHSIDTSKAKIYNEIARLYTRLNLDSAEVYAQEALYIEEKLNYQRGLVRTWGIFAVIASGKNNLDKAIRYNKLSLKAAETVNDKLSIAIATHDIGVLYYRQSNYIAALDYYQRSLNMSQEINDTLGINYSMSNIGSIHYELKNYKKAYEYYELAALIGINSKDLYTLTQSYTNLANVAAYRGDTLRAIQLEKKVINYAEENRDDWSLGYSCLSLGYYALHFKKIEEAKFYYNKAFQAAETVGDSILLINAYIGFSKLALAQKQYAEAINNTEKALSIVSNLEGKGSYEAYINENFAEIYAAKGDFKKAYKYQKFYQTLNDSLVSSDNRQLIANMETLYKTNEKEKENELLKIQNDKILNQQYIINAISIFLFITILMLFVFGYDNYRRKKGNIKLLEEKVEERTLSLKTANTSLERFNYVASHDLKEPLRSIVSSTQLLERNLETNPQNQQFMGFIKRDAKRLYELVNAMILAAKYKQIELKPVEVDLNISILKVVEGLQTLFEEKNASIEFENLPTIKVDPTTILLILRQLIQNAIIFNESESPLVKIKVCETNNQWEIYFSDNGIGINEEFHEKVFEAFKRLHHYDKYSGTGVGLFLAKDMIEMQNGKIEILPNQKIGTTFKITLMK